MDPQEENKPEEPKERGSNLNNTLKDPKRGKQSEVITLRTYPDVKAEWDKLCDYRINKGLSKDRSEVLEHMMKFLADPWVSFKTP